MFALNSRITIGKYQFRGGVADLKIKKSVSVIMQTATLKIPAISRIKGNDALPQSSIETAKLFKEGDSVTIELGYNGVLKEEFVGFVRRVNLSTPAELELEGYAYLLRKVYLKKSYAKATVREILTDLTAGTEIELSDKIADVTVYKVNIKNANGLEVLDYIKSKWCLRVYFIGKKLYVGLEETLPLNAKPVRYRLGWNVVRDNQLKYHNSDEKILVRVVRKPKKGKPQVVYEVGDKGGSVRELRPPNMDDAACKKLADSALELAKRNGYEGKITAFLQPYCDFAYAIEIDDPKFGERKGRYFVDGIEIQFGARGARRVLDIKRRLSV